MKRLLRNLEILFYLACALLLVWLLISWVDVMTHNIPPGGGYWEYNIFNLIAERMG